MTDIPGGAALEARLREQYSDKFDRLESLEQDLYYSKPIETVKITSSLQDSATSSGTLVVEDAVVAEFESKPKEMKPVTQKIQAKPYTLGCCQPLGKRARSYATLEELSEKLITERYKRFVPTNFDLTDYDRELFQKKLDLETMKIYVTYAANDYRREVTREPN